jgi:ketosteroid isomerase-like protein
MTRPPLSSAAALLATTEDAENQFYEALQLGDLDRLMAVWSDDEEIICVLPGCARAIGGHAVRAEFETLIGYGPLNVTPHYLRRTQFGNIAIHHLLEKFLLQDNSSPQNPRTVTRYAVVTHVYIQGTQGWRLLVHHGSHSQQGDIEEVTEKPPSVLH